MPKVPDVKVPLLKENGRLADPVRYQRHGIIWEFTVVPTFNDEEMLSLDLRMEVVDFGGYTCCFMAGLAMNSAQFSRFDNVFHANKSTFMFRDFAVAKTRKPNGAYCLDMFRFGDNRRAEYDPLAVFVEKAANGTVKIRASNGFLRDPKFEEKIVQTFIFSVEMHMSMPMTTYPEGTIDIIWHQPTFKTEHLGQKFEFNIAWFERIRPNMKELLDGIEQMSKEEFLNLQKVLGLYYHGYATGKLIDGRILPIMRLAEQMGFQKLDVVDGGFAEIGKVTMTGESGLPALDVVTPSSGKDSHLEECNFKGSETIFRFEQSFDDVLFKLSIFPSKIKDQKYLSMSVVFFPPPNSRHHVTIKFTSELFNGQFSRYITTGQRSMGVPTFYRCSEEIEDRELGMLIEVKYEKVAQLEKVEPSEMPGINDLVLKFGEKNLAVNKDHLLEHFAFFRSYASFENGVPDEIELKTFAYEDVLRVLDILYHKTVLLTELEFKQLVVTADALVCEEVLNISEQSLDLEEE